MLIPKIESPSKSYWPISLPNKLYKIISRILPARLKPLMGKIINPCQTVFIPSRFISDNVLLLHDLLLGFHLNKGKSRMCLKIDLCKAFDSVWWDFLEGALKSFNLPPIFINWILQCITSPSFSVLVNGSPAGFFQSIRGLKQGCHCLPISLPWPWNSSRQP